MQRSLIQSNCRTPGRWRGRTWPAADRGQGVDHTRVRLALASIQEKGRGRREASAFSVPLDLKLTVPSPWERLSRSQNSPGPRSYFGARYYSGPQGRFTSPDEIFADQDLEDPQSWNLYAYVTNNPLQYVDEDGRGKVSVFFKVVTKYVMTDAGPQIFKKVTRHKLSRDEARRLFRKRKEDVFGSKKGSKNVAGKDAIEDPVHGTGAGDQMRHFHDANRSGGHAFFDKSLGIMVPFSDAGRRVFGDNFFGEAVDFFNPLDDAQAVVDVVEAVLLPNGETITPQPPSPTPPPFHPAPEPIPTPPPPKPPCPNGKCEDGQ